MAALSSLDFNATNSVVAVGATSPMANIWNGGGSIAGWFYADGFGEGSAGQIFQKYTTLGWHLSIVNIGFGFMGLRLGVDLTGGERAWYDQTFTSVLSVWNYFWWTWDSTSPTTAPNLWMNGVSRAVTLTAVGSGTYNSDAGVNLNIGNNGSGSQTWDGKLCYLQCWNRVLSTGEFQEATYKPGSIRPNLQGYWPLVGPNTSALDLSGNGSTGTLSNTAGDAAGPPVRCFI